MIIGICGKKRAGKDTVADMLVGMLGGCKKMSFAWPIKRIAEVLTDVPAWLWDDDEDGDTPKEDYFGLYGMTGRELLQAIGDMFRRRFGDDVWVKARFNEEEDFLADYNVITDVRFRKEAEAVKERGGILVHVTRDVPDDDPHVSEHDMDGYKGYDYEIANDGTLDDLKTKVDAFASSIRK